MGQLYRVKNRDFPVVYDMRDSAWLTPVKSQSGGGCWAYSTMGAVESRLLMLEMGEYNLSDNNLKYCNKYIPERSTNGNHWMSSAYFARRSGPYLEIEDPYPGGTTGSENCPNDLSATFYIPQSRYPPPQDIDAIKQTVLDYGAVWSLLYYNSTYLDPDDDTYYYGGTTEVNHAGVVVGWNDNLVTAGGTGAWIVRNTYGAGFADNGYYYISYNDSQFVKYNAYWPVIMENEANTTIYQYDKIGGLWGVGFDNEVAYGLVKFTNTAEDLEIKKIGTFVVATGSGIEIKIYSQFNESLSGLLGSMDETIVGLPGYYTFDLDSTVFIASGQDFYIQLKYDSNDPAHIWPMSVEDTVAGYAMPEIETGKFWISPDPTIWPTTWYPIGHNTVSHYDLCIKAYTEKITVPKVATGHVAVAYTNHAEVSSNSIVSIGDGVVIQKGICWNTLENPTINDDKTTEGEGQDSFNSMLTNLLPSTKYYFKAYATNVTGTGYGDVDSISTLSCDNEMLVLNTSDAGYGSLREAFTNICNDGIITLSDDLDGETLTLTTGAITATQPTTIDNSGHTSGFTINGTGNNVIIPESGSLVIAPGSKITITGAIENNAGNGGLVIQSSALGTGSLINSTSALAATIQRYIPQNTFWHLVSPPVNNTSAEAFVGHYMQFFTESSAAWTDIVEPSTTLLPLTGYALWSGESTYTFRGNLNTGIQSVATTKLYLDPEDEVYYGWNLVGNPYPSSIDWSMLDDVWGAVYYWNGTAYATWVDGASTNGGVQYVPPMQGFFISSDGSNFELSDAARTHEGSSAYFKSLPENSLLLKAIVEFNSDEVCIRLMDNATPDFDREYDAWKLSSGDSNAGELYSLSSSGRFSIDSRPVCNFVPLGFKCSTMQIFSLSLKEMNGITTAILEDTKTGTFHDLTKSNYEFVWDVTDNEIRFKLHFNSVGIGENKIGESKILIYADGQQLFIRSERGGTLRISDVMGRVVMEREILAAGMQVLPSKFKTGIYLVNFRSGKEVNTQKIFIY